MYTAHDAGGAAGAVSGCSNQKGLSLHEGRGEAGGGGHAGAVALGRAERRARRGRRGGQGRAAPGRQPALRPRAVLPAEPATSRELPAARERPRSVWRRRGGHLGGGDPRPGRAMALGREQRQARRRGVLAVRPGPRGADADRRGLAHRRQPSRRAHGVRADPVRRRPPPARTCTADPRGRPLPAARPTRAAFASSPPRLATPHRSTPACRTPRCAS